MVVAAIFCIVGLHARNHSGGPGLCLKPVPPGACYVGTMQSMDWSSPG